ncbi:unnamed protein product [Protopolystoma xenopodis]|uniref:Uncharacterized protein n=1 Tax=Protopolystoma xenopodis TaxID=117903 RepID=A0A3S5AS61_9PLAT|nr:unnamed protein product [Protopolystoma xenopodis]
MNTLTNRIPAKFSNQIQVHLNAHPLTSSPHPASSQRRLRENNSDVVSSTFLDNSPKSSNPVVPHKSSLPFHSRQPAPPNSNYLLGSKPDSRPDQTRHLGEPNKRSECRETVLRSCSIKRQFKGLERDSSTSSTDTVIWRPD